jgi:signal transduction histidine kinase
MVALEQTQLFNHLSPEALRGLRAAAVERSVPRGGDIFKEGDGGDGVYVVKDGLVQISGIVGDNVRHIFARIGPGEIFGEMAVLENKPRSASASAAQDTTVYFIPREFMLQLVEASPQLSLKLLREISARLREFNRQYLREVLQSERLSVIGRFARSIIHDLKNPLHIISLSAEMAALDTASATDLANSNLYIRKQVGRINDMVNEILEFTQGSPATFELAPTDYAVFVRQLVDELRAELQLKTVTIEMETPPPAITLMVNRKRLQHLFRNLVHNAVEAMPKGGKILLRFRANNVEIATEISDTGPGIPPEIINRLFEPFITHGKKQGTGLGLSICKKIVEDHQGHIFARNAASGGAVFSFSLPLPKPV